MEKSILQQINSAFCCPLKKINETLDNVTITTRSKIINIPPYDVMLHLIDIIPSRDDINILMSYSDDTVFEISSQNKPLNDDFDEFKKTVTICATEEDEIELSIYITKKIEDSRMSVYSASDFCDCLFSKSLYSVIRKMEYLFKTNDVMYLELLSDEDTTIITPTFALTTRGASSQLASTFSRSEKLRIIQENANIQSQLHNCLLPEDFNVTFSICDKKYISVLNILKTIFSAGYVSNVFSINEKEISLKVAGYRPNSCILHLEQGEISNLSIEHPNVWFDIYNWVYTGANPSDKIEIARNIISLHCQYKDILNIDKNLLHSMCSNYAVYLKNSVSQYIAIKEEVGRRIIQITQELEKSLEELTSNIKRSFLAILTFILSIIITHMQDAGMENIFSNRVKFLTFIVILGCITYEYLSWIEFVSSTKRIKRSKELFEKNYQEYFYKDEFERIINPELLQEHAISYDRVAQRYVIISIVFFIMILILVFNMNAILYYFQLIVAEF